MIKQIKLTRSHGRLSNREPFIMAENELLVLEFISDYKLNELLITVNDYEKEKQYRVKGNKFVVTKDFYKAGTINIAVALLIKGEVVKEFTVEPILIKEISAGFEGLPELDALKEQITDLSDRLKALEDKHKVIL